MFITPAHMTACPRNKPHHVCTKFGTHLCTCNVISGAQVFLFVQKRGSHFGPCRPWRCSQQAAPRTFADLVSSAAGTRAGTATATLIIASPRTRCQPSVGARANALPHALSANGLTNCVITAVECTPASPFQRGLRRKTRTL